MSGQTSAAPAWILEGLGKFYAPTMGDADGAPSSGSMAASRVRWLRDNAPGTRMGAHAVAVLDLRGTGQTVELADGRRGMVIRAWLPTMRGESVSWREAGARWARDIYAAASFARGKSLGNGEDVEVAVMVDVELNDAPHDVVRVEVERVTVPAPAAGDVEAFMARKRDPHWKRPAPTMPKVRRTPRGTASRIGIGSRVRMEHSAATFVVIDQAPQPACWWLQDIETGEVQGYSDHGAGLHIGAHVRDLENLGPHFADELEALRA